MISKQQKLARKRRKAAPKKRRRLRAQPSPNAFAYTQEDAQAMGGPARTKLYELRMDGTLKSFVDPAGRVMIVGDSLREFLRVNITADQQKEIVG
jgi:hypothetical protein